MENHRRAVDRLVAELEGDPRFCAVLLGGSIARGSERPDSDIDLILIASDEEYARRLPERDFSYLNQEVCDYPGGYAEGKVVPLSFLEEVAERGSEPARAAFAGVRILFSRIPGLEDLLQRAAAYPEAERIGKIRSFYAQVLVQYWYITEAERLDDRYLMMRAVSDFALFCGRLILAHNRILFPHHKWLMHDLRNAPEKPDGLVEKLERLLEEPTRANANPVLEAVLNFRDWEKPPVDVSVQYMEDSEWHWRRGPAPISDR